MAPIKTPRVPLICSVVGVGLSSPVNQNGRGGPYIGARRAPWALRFWATSKAASVLESELSCTLGSRLMSGPTNVRESSPSRLVAPEPKSVGLSLSSGVPSRTPPPVEDSRETLFVFFIVIFGF